MRVAGILRCLLDLRAGRPTRLVHRRPRGKRAARRPRRHGVQGEPCLSGQGAGHRERHHRVAGLRLRRLEKENTMEPHKVLIHLRFAPNGTVVEISERPKSLTPHEWFNFLGDKAGNAYQALSGGRGVVPLTAEEVEAFKAEYPPTAA